MNRRQKIIISVTGIFIVLLVLLGLTYAYFLTRITGNGNPTSISVTTANLIIEYGDGNGEVHSAEKLMPGNPIIFKQVTRDSEGNLSDVLTDSGELSTVNAKTFTVTNKGNAETAYSVVLQDVIIEYASTFVKNGQQILEGTTTTIEKGGLKINITCSSNLGNACTGISDYEFPIGNDEILTNSVKVGEVHTYSLTMVYEDTGFDQSDDMNKTFSAKVNIADVNGTFNIEGTVTDSDADYVQINSTPRISKIINGKYKIVGVEYGSHTIEVYDKNGNRIGDAQPIIISKGVEENTSFTNNTVTLTGATNNISIDLKLENGNYKVDTSSIETVKPEANAPVLAEGMIPVVYDGTNWVVASADNWYDYDNQKWANAVTVSNASLRTATAGTTIPMDSINSMWVWIPRFKYKINQLGGKRVSGETLGTISPITNPEMIDVVFENGTKTTGVTEETYRLGISETGKNSNYYTHPAFRNGSVVYNNEPYDIGGWTKELTGLWFAKFETGNTIENQVIKPNVTAINNQYLADRFVATVGIANGVMDAETGVVTFSANVNNVYGLNTTTNTTNTHISKNTEWGAVAILSQSKYGKMGNDDYSGTNKEMYVNNSSLKYTGRSSGDTAAATTSEAGTCEYNNTTNNCGVGASTTGTIYGIYDMSGGSWEHMMAHWKGRAGEYGPESSGKYGTNYLKYISGFNGYVLYSYNSEEDLVYNNGINFPTAEYHDQYEIIEGTNEFLGNTILGDSMHETTYWYSDNPYHISWKIPWITRGGRFDSKVGAGIFASSYSAGESSANSSYRIVLIP